MTSSLQQFLPYRLARLSEAVSREIRPVYRDHFGLKPTVDDTQKCTRS